MTKRTLTQALVPILRRPVEETNRRLAAVHLLDWIATAVGSRPRPESTALLALADQSPQGPAWVAHAGGRDPATAALVNGGLALVLEMDATHRTAKLHPGPPVIAAALAAGAVGHPSGGQLLDAIVRGYEAMIRVGLALGPGHYRLWHTTGTAGSFGAAAAAGALLGLDDTQLVDALGLAGSRTSGLWQTRVEKAMAKPLHAGGAAQAGYYAAMLAAAGMSGPRAILEGELGLFAAAGPDAVPAEITRDSTGDWLIHETSLKPWGACRHVHPAIDAALQVRDRLGGDAAIDRVRVGTYPEALTFADDPAPQGEQAAMFSLQHCVALALLRGRAHLEDFADDTLRDEARLVHLRQRVAVEATEPWTAAYPEHWGAAVEVQTTDGRLTTGAVHDTLGDPERPLEPAAVRAKADQLLERGGVDPARRTLLADTVLNLPGAPTLADLALALP